MRPRRSLSSSWVSGSWRTFAALIVLLSLAHASGCKSSSHTSDPALRTIVEILDTKLPNGTARSRVSSFCSVHGYEVRNAKDSTLTVVIHHIDTDTLRPVTAEVTFRFDPNDKLISYD